MAQMSNHLPKPLRLHGNNRLPVNVGGDRCYSRAQCFSMTGPKVALFDVEFVVNLSDLAFYHLIRGFAVLARWFEEDLHVFFLNGHGLVV